MACLNKNFSKNIFYNIQSPSLKYLLRFYGYFSIQLFPFNFCHFPSLAHAFWNLFLASFAFYRVSEFQKASQSDIDPVFAAVVATKPLFGIVVTIGLNFLYLTTTVLNTFYFVFINYNSSKLIRLLDIGFCQIAPFNSVRQSRRFIFKLVAVYMVVFLISNTSLFYGTVRRGGLAFCLRQTTISFLLNINNHAVFVLTHYYKYGTLVSLNRLISTFCHHSKQQLP